MSEQKQSGNTHSFRTWSSLLGKRSGGGVFKSGLKRRIFLGITCLVALPLAAAFAVSWANMNRMVRERQIAAYEENTEYLSMLCSNMLKGIAKTSLFLYYDEQVMDILTATGSMREAEQGILDSKAASIFYSDPEIEAVTFYVRKNQLLIHRQRNKTTRYYVEKDPEKVEQFFYGTSDPTSLQGTIRIVSDNESQENRIVLDQEIMDLNNQPLLRMEVVYRQSRLHSLCLDNPAVPGSHFLLDESGTIITVNSVLSEDEAGQLLYRLPEGTSERTEGTDSVLICRKIPGYPFYVVKCIRSADLLSNMKVYETGLITIFLVVILVIVMLSFGLSRLIVRPVRELIQMVVREREQGREGNGFLEEEKKSGKGQEIERIEELSELADTYREMMQEIDRLIEEKSEARYREKEAFLTMCTLQINPHFLYNTLQTIQSMALRRNAFEINASAISLARILRYSLDWERQEVALSEEIENLREYLNIQKFRYMEELELEIEIPSDLPAIRTPKMILQPIVENCFVHGFKDKTEQFCVSIALEENAREVLIRISDNGKGVAADEAEAANKALEQGGMKITAHTGLLGVNYRLREMHPGASIRLELGEWFSVVIRIPKEDA